MRTILLLLLMCSCGGPRGPNPAKFEALGVATPRLPAPEAQVYATRLGSPGDPLVASVVGELPWEESLSGAAGAIGVDAAGGQPLDDWRVRWAALRAGYPYPIHDFSYELVPEGDVGQRVIQGLNREVRPGDHVGLVRVRGGQGDYWVGLIGRPIQLLEPVPRALPRGAELSLAAQAGTASGLLQLSLVSPSGRLEQGDLWQGREVTLEEQGRYWVEVRQPGGVVASFPVFAGVPVDPAPPLAATLVLAGDPDSLELAAWELLDAFRGFYGWASPQGDPILGAVARAHLDDRLGHGGPRSGDFRGEPGSCRAALSCGLLAGVGVETCFHGWLVDPESRAGLLDPRCSLAGMAVGERGDRLWLQLELGQE